MGLRLAHLSDIHFGGENVAAVEAATVFLNSQAIDLVVLTGDLTLYGAHEEFAAAKSWLDALGGNVLSTPGNHDTPWAGLLERVVAPFRRYEQMIGPRAEAEYATPELAVWALNTARGWQLRLNWSKGAVTRGQVRRVISSLEESPPAAVRVLACHHPLLEVAGEPITAGVHGGSLAARALASAGVDLILSGHLHTPFLEPVPSGDDHTYAVGAGTLSLRERGAPPSFNLIEIDGEALAVTVMAWTDGVLKPVERWDRRLRGRHAPTPAASAKMLAP